MKKRYFFIILFLIIILCYVTNIAQIPENIVLLSNEKLNIKKMYGISFEAKEKQILETWQGENVESQNVDIKLFGKIKVKEVSVTTIPQIKVVPVGNLIGLKLYTNGVLVIGMAELTNTENEIQRPYETTNIKEGDTIIELDHQEIDSIKTLQTIVNNSGEKNIEVKYVHDRRNFNFKYTTNESK